MNLSSPPSTPRKSEKRAPTTPLLPSKHQNKKSSAAKLEKPVPKLLLMDVTSSPHPAYEKELLHSKFHIWTLEKRWKEQKDLSLFLELERELADV